MFTCVLCIRLLLQSYQCPNLSESADPVGGQLRGDKECPFSDVTKSGRVWRKVPESDARSVGSASSRVMKRASKRALYGNRIVLHQTQAYCPGRRP